VKVLNELIDGAFGIVPEIYDFIAPTITMEGVYVENER